MSIFDGLYDRYAIQREFHKNLQSTCVSSPFITEIKIDKKVSAIIDT